MNDPFAGVAAGTGSFQLLHYGGDAWRWERDFTFRYVPSRGTWELVEVFDRLSHAVGFEPSREATFRAPGDFRRRGHRGVQRGGLDVAAVTGGGRIN